MTRKELISSPGYWEEKIQQDLVSVIQQYMDHHGLSRMQFAEKIGVTKSYVSQLMAGYTDHRISKLVDLALCIGKVPLVDYKSLNKVIYEDEQRTCMAYEQTRTTKQVMVTYDSWAETGYPIDFGQIVKGNQTVQYKVPAFVNP